MFKRELYLSRIRPFYDNEQIKILMGVRRSGKTELLKMIIGELSASKGPDDITYLSFELLENRPLRNAETLYAFLEDRISSGVRYVFLDEIQFVEDWPEVVNSVKTKHPGTSIFVTGSNSALLNDDKEGVLGGRTISFRIMPFTFREGMGFLGERDGTAAPSPAEAFADYLVWGGFPLIFSQREPQQREIMLESIFDSIVLRDIVQRRKIRNSLTLERILDFVVASSSQYISGRNIADRLAKARNPVSLPVVLGHLSAIAESCIASFVPRFDIIGLATLELNNKAYVCDPAFIGYKKSLVNDLYGSIFETIVHNELVARGWTVKTGTVRGKEIDFVATRHGDRRIYVQVAYDVTPQNAGREFGNLAEIDDNWPKFVVSRDTATMSRNGIRHVNIVDFLLSDNIETID
jgi:predicted AAA+ superfamily ATPase